MSTKRFLLNHGKDLIVGGLLLAYILSDLKNTRTIERRRWKFRWINCGCHDSLTFLFIVSS